MGTAASAWKPHVNSWSRGTTCDPRARRTQGERALASFGQAASRAAFVQADLSTRDGVERAASQLLAAHDQFDAVLHTTGVITSQELRTADGLHPFFAVNYLSRYHLTQRLLPALRRGNRARVVIDRARPTDHAGRHRSIRITRRSASPACGKPIQIANHHYAAHLTASEPGLLAGVVNAGAAITDIFRMQPRRMRATAAIVGPLFFDSIEKAARNAVAATSRVDWTTNSYWPKTGDFGHPTPITLDAATTEAVVAASRELTGV